MKYSSKNGIEKQQTVDMSVEEVFKPASASWSQRSHFIMFASSFMYMLGNCLIQNGSWAYLNRVTNSADKVSYGWMVSISAVGPILCSPMFGYLSNRMKSIRVPCILCLLLLTTGNIFYSLLYAFEGMGRIALVSMAIARLLIGMGGVLPSLIQTYIVSSTDKEERTSRMTLNFVAQEFGYVLGACIQILIGLKFNVRLEGGIPGLVIDEFNVGGWLAILIGFANLILLFPCFFKEETRVLENIPQEAPTEIKKTPLKDTAQNPNYVGALTAVLICGMVVTPSSTRETLGNPMVEDLYAVSPSLAAVYVSSISAGSVLLVSVILLLAHDKLSRYDSRKVLVWGGLLVVSLGFVLHYPFFGGSVKLATCGSSTMQISSGEAELKDSVSVEQPHTLNSYAFLTSIVKNANTSLNEDKEDCFGCPYKEQPWCETTKLIAAPQMIAGYIITRIGLGITLCVLPTLYSKIFGSLQMGVWIGLLTAVMTASKLVSPIWLSYVYQNYGPLSIFGTLFALVSLSMLLSLAFFKQMAPMNATSKKE